ncbi:MAG: hypothetical protein Q8Q09_10115 [Deltaproteobacteria bacterium]|nr:hypothetical protein [Deltaproteobacteria bacterium]
MRARLTFGLIACIAGCSTPNSTPDVVPRDVLRESAATDALGPAEDVAQDTSREQPSDLVAIAIEPATATLTVRDAMPTTLALRAVVVRRDGVRTALTTGVWSIDNDLIATVSSDGVVSASGLSGGTVLVTVRATGAGAVMLSATATVEVNIDRAVAPSGSLAAHIARFADAAVMDPARSATVHYPLRDTVMPHNVAPADIQWERGVMGDVFRVQIRKPHVTVTAYVAFDNAGFQFHWVPDRALWRVLADSDPTEPCTLTVDRSLAGSSAVIAGEPQRFSFARGGIYGNVYYWYWTGATEGQIMRVADGTAMRSRAVPNPPPDPVRGQRCPGCHTASRDGRFLATPLGGGVDGAAVFDFTRDLSGNPSPTLFATNRISDMWFFTFDPTSTRLLGVSRTGAMRAFDVLTGASVASTGLPVANAIHPEWSPNGASVALIQREDGRGDEFTRGNLAVMQAVDIDNFLAPRVIHQGNSLSTAPEGGAADAHPTWSPDSRMIAFAHGEHSYSGDSFVVINDPRPFGGALYAIAPAGGPPVRLDRANGGTMGRDSYWPTFSPFVTREGDSGGYYWLAFMSRREYGNAQVGTRGLRSQGRGGGRLQIWVTAIDTNAPAGTDPSRAAYWLPGQDLATGNFGANWAPVACRSTTAECTTDGECCSGRCRPDPAMPARSTCQPPPAAECRREGQTCGANGDCCEGLSCFANVCARPIG